MEGRPQTSPEATDAGSSTFARNALSSYGLRAVLALSALVLTPYLFRQLGPAGFGTWSVVFVLSTVVVVLQMGFANAVTKFVAEQRAADAGADVGPTISAATSLMAMVGAGALVLCVAGAFVLDPLAADEHRDAFRVGMVALGVALAIRLPTTVYAAALVGLHRYDMANLGAAATAVSFAVGAVVAVEAGAGVEGVMLALAGSLALGGLGNAYALRRIDRRAPLRPRRDRATQRRLAGFGVFALLADTMVLVSQRLDTVTIAAIAGAAAAGPYAAVAKLQTGIQSLTAPFVDLLMPMVSELSARGERAEVTRRLALTLRVTLQVTLPVAAAIAIFSEDLVGVWLGDEVPSSAADVVAVLMAAQVLGMAVAPATEALIGVGRVRAVAAMAVAEGTVNLTLTIVLVAVHGAIGAAIGTAVAAAVVGPWRLPLAARATGARLAGLVRTGVVLPIASTLPALVAMLAVHVALDEGLARLAIGVTAGLGLALAVAAAQVGPVRLAAIAHRRPVSTVTP